MKTVLVTCVGSGVGQSVIDSLNLKREYKIIGCDGNPNVYAHSYCDEFFVVPGLYSEGYVDFILNLCLENKVDVVVPGHDHELVMFANQYDLFKMNGIEVVVSEPEIIAISRDKKEWFDFFEPLGCKIVPTVSVGDFIKNPDVTILPAIVKPSGGSASQGIYIINDLSELKGLNEDDIIQPYLFPEETDENYQKIYNAVKKGKFLQMSEVSIQLIFNSKAEFSGIFISKNTLKNGVPVFVDTINPDSFEYIDEILKFVPILESHGVRGPVNIQGRVTPKGLYFFEMNMRFTGITGNRALLGFNEVSFLVNDFLGLECKLNGYSFNKVGVRQVACTTIPRQGDRIGHEVLTVLGAGSNLGESYLKGTSRNYNRVNLIVRKESLRSYQDKFEGLSNVFFVAHDDCGLEQVLCQTDTLINFVSALAYKEDAEKYDAIRFVQKMVVKISKAKINKVINISSQSVYSQGLNVSKDEKDIVECNNAYSFQKLMIEELFGSIKNYNPLSKVTSLRLSRVICPEIKGQSGFFGDIIKDIKAKNAVNIDNPMNNTNLVHVDDIVFAIDFVLNRMNENSVPSVLNVGGENISMQDYIDLVVKLVKPSENKVTLNKSKEVKSSSMIDCKVINEMGWSATYKVEDIIKHLI